MSKQAKSRLLKYGITSGLCLAVSIALAYYRGFFDADLLNRYRILSDAFYIPGILLIMFGLLTWLTNEGALNGLTYVFSYAFKALVPGGRFQRETYGQYVMRKREEATKGFGFLFVVGLIFFAVGIVFLLLFYSVNPQ